ncbi:MAG: S9 family peptidase [Rivularia sp. (in: Bacteria)]|nr:S9 family peptidase [Rivularia sp. MS3]
MSDKSFPSIEEFIAFPKLVSVSISNDGEKIAYVQRLTNWDDNIFQYHICIYKKGKTYTLTTGKTDSFSPSWSSDCKTLAYLCKTNRKNDRNQIYIKKENDTAPIQVSHAPDGVRSFKWAKNENGFFFIAREPEPKNIKKRREIYGDIEYVDKESRCQCLFYIDLQKGIDKTTDYFSLPKDLREKQDNADDTEKSEKDNIATQLTRSKNLHISTFDISPLGDKIVFAAAPSPRIEDGQYSKLYLLDIESQETQKLDIPHSGIKGKILFSSDGTKICFTFDRDNKIYNNRLLAIFNLETQTISYPQIEIDESIYPLQWLESGIFIEWLDKTNSCIGIVKENGDITNLVKEDCYIKAASISLDGKNISYIKGSLKECFEVYVNNTRITNYSHLLNDYLYTRKQVIKWLSSDGSQIEGILCIPPDFDSTLEYPLLVIVHGGPINTSLAIPFGDNPIYPVEKFIEKGFVVLQPNYRGSAGYGEAFRSLNYRDLGTGDYADVISGVDLLISQGFINSEKIGIMGWSQGGYISAFCSTYSNRFKAISVGAGISNWITYYVSTDIHYFTQHYLGDTPWKDPEIYRKTSPITYIKSACTPTLIQHGDRDRRVPISNAYELYQGLQDMGVETQLVVLKNIAHSPQKPGVYRALMKQNLTWFSHHLLSEDFDNFNLLHKD